MTRRGCSECRCLQCQPLITGVHRSSWVRNTGRVRSHSRRFLHKGGEFTRDGRSSLHPRSIHLIRKRRSPLPLTPSLTAFLLQRPFSTQCPKKTPFFRSIRGNYGFEGGKGANGGEEGLVLHRLEI